jgi:hypothetical protein
MRLLPDSCQSHITFAFGGRYSVLLTATIVQANFTSLFNNAFGVE